jgi:glycosyltransferase involved in cell wall biosynthesis
MRILIVSPYRSCSAGGVERYLQTGIPGLLDRGHDVGLLYEYAFDPRSEPIDPPTRSIRSWCLSEEGSSGALALIREWKPDVVYFHGLDGAESIAIEDALLEAYPVALFVHGHDRTCATGRKYYSFPQPQNCTRCLGPMCLLIHYPRRCGGLHPGTMWRRYRRNRQLHSRLSKHNAVLVASKSMYCELKQHGVQLEKLHLVPLPTTGITPQTAAPIPKVPRSHILFLGRLTDLKGVDYLIRAIPKAAHKLGRPLTLTIAGEGRESGKLRALAVELNAPVEFFGWAESLEKVNVIRRADLLAVPSLWPEPFALVGIEAGCLGVPAVGYDSGGIPDWLISGESGELAPTPPTVDGLAEAIVRALHSPEHYARLCVGAWNVAQRFTLKNHLDRLEPILAAAASMGTPVQTV